MKYLKKYGTKSAYDADYYSGAIPFPHVALVAGEVIYAEQFESVTDERTPLYIEALEDLTVKFSRNAIQYSMDNSTWVDLPVDTATPTVSAGSKIYFRATGLKATSSSYGIGTFTISGRCNLGGNTMSMLHGADFIGQLYLTTSYTFCRLFYGQAKIINAKRLILPAMTLKTYCYYYMFYNCASLEEAPELPAMDLSSYCYSYMFSGCSSLKKAPVLPALTLTTSCYNSMFSNCTSLEAAPELPALTLMSSCYSNMFNGCSNLQYIKAMFTSAPNSVSSSNSSWVNGVAAAGTFVKNAAATWENTFGANAIPTGWAVELAEE